MSDRVCVRCRRGITPPEALFDECGCPCCDHYASPSPDLADVIGLCEDCKTVVMTTLLPEVRSVLMGLLQ